MVDWILLQREKKGFTLISFTSFCNVSQSTPFHMINILILTNFFFDDTYSKVKQPLKLKIFCHGWNVKMINALECYLTNLSSKQVVNQSINMFKN